MLSESQKVPSYFDVIVQDLSAFGGEAKLGHALFEASCFNVQPENDQLDSICGWLRAGNGASDIKKFSLPRLVLPENSF